MNPVCLTPGEGRIIHRFFDSSPISPSGKYIALFRMPYEDKSPSPGDAGEVVVTELKTGIENTVYVTRGWEMQVGANVQWGATDNELLFNDVDTITWKPFGVKFNIFTGEYKKLDGCVFTVSPDGKFTATTCPVRARLTQLGYGVVIPDDFVPHNNTPPDDDGLFMTDTVTGECRLLVSIRELVRACPQLSEDAGKDAEYYGFQCKFSPDGERLLFVLRCIVPDRKRRDWVLTMNRGGGDIEIAVSAELWARGGHHINWHPDSEHLTMNLRPGKKMNLAVFCRDGSDFRTVPGVIGTGHPSVHKNCRYIITDAYIAHESDSTDGTVPLRLINIETGDETELLRVKTLTPRQFIDSSLRLDPHPAWDKSGRYIVYNGFEDGTRRVYLLDMEESGITL